MNNLLPGAQKSIPYMTETTILLWKMLELNKVASSRVLTRLKFTELDIEISNFRLGT